MIIRAHHSVFASQICCWNRHWTRLYSETLMSWCITFTNWHLLSLRALRCWLSHVKSLVKRERNDRFAQHQAASIHRVPVSHPKLTHSFLRSFDPATRGRTQFPFPFTCTARRLFEHHKQNSQVSGPKYFPYRPGHRHRFRCRHHLSRNTHGTITRISTKHSFLMSQSHISLIFRLGKGLQSWIGCYVDQINYDTIWSHTHKLDYVCICIFVSICRYPCLHPSKCQSLAADISATASFHRLILQRQRFTCTSETPTR